MIPVYKEGNILFYILNKIVLTRYTPKKSLQTFSAPFRKKTTHSYNAIQKGWSGPKVLIRCELVFCNWATSNGQQTEAQCLAKQALLCICFCKIRLFYFCFCGRWHFWFCGGTFSKDFQVVLWNLKSLIRILYYFIKVSFFHLVISIY